MSEIDQAFAAARGNPIAFAGWVGRVERPLRLSLRAYARAVDVEGVMQETLLRMWTLAHDPERRLTGENASLRFAIGVARNVARNEARRLGRERLLPPEEMPDLPTPPEPSSDPRLRELIADCLAKISARPLAALRARMQSQAHRSDRDIARAQGLTLNTFLQNIVRARKQLIECLARHAVPLEEILR